MTRSSLENYTGNNMTQQDTTLDNTSATRNNKNTTRDNASSKQRKIYFAWFIYIIATYSKPGKSGSKALLML